VCRLALRLGPPRPIGDLLTAPHGLAVQSYAPRQQQHGNVNVDGTGVAWWPDDADPAPLRYATLAPPWADANLSDLGRRLTAGSVLAAVRGATPGIGHGADLVAPFVVGDLAVAHNGWLGGFRDGVAATLLRMLPDDLLSGLPGVSDSRVLALLIVAHRRRGAALPDAVELAVADAVAACRVVDQPATLNLVVTDGTEAVAVRGSLGLPGNSLWLATDAPAWPGCTVVASEPLDHADPASAAGWSSVPDATLVHVEPTGTVTTRSLHPLEEHA
jgi:gamma-glutamyl hercynylcysteine S-oxide hydrolase